MTPVLLSRASSSAERLAPSTLATLTLAVLACLPLRADTMATERSYLTGDRYPVEVSISYAAALFHWLDSLVGVQAAGISAGKTVAAHREDFERVLGPMSARDRELLGRFARIRRTGDAAALLVTFLDAPDLQSAVERSAPLLDEDDHASLSEVIRHFAPRYSPIWDGGRVPRKFLARCRRDKALEDLEALLARVAAFFEVTPSESNPPCVVLVPVGMGHGTHAQANGRHLLVEVRPVDRLATAASVIVHENAHMLMDRMPLERRRDLDRRLTRWGPRAVRAGLRLREALPTALGQGVADRDFRPRRWSTDIFWYHIEEIDHYAKVIYPTVLTALDGGSTFDEALLRRLVDLYPVGVSPRSP